MPIQIVVNCDKCKSQMDYLHESDTFGYGSEKKYTARTYVVVMQFKCPDCGRELQRRDQRTDNLVSGQWQRSTQINVAQSYYSLDGIDLSKFNPEMLAMGRGLRGLEARRVAAKSGVKWSEINALENGQPLTNPELIKRIAKALELPVAFFFREGKSETRNIFFCMSQDESPAPITKIKILDAQPKHLFCRMLHIGAA